MQSLCLPAHVQVQQLVGTPGPPGGDNQTPGSHAQEMKAWLLIKPASHLPEPAKRSSGSCSDSTSLGLLQNRFLTVLDYSIRACPCPPLFLKETELPGMGKQCRASLILHVAVVSVEG